MKAIINYTIGSNVLSYLVYIVIYTPLPISLFLLVMKASTYTCSV